MKCVAVVPMKLTNRRLPGKNTKSFTNGAPLCTYILNSLLRVNKIDEVYVYCSDPSIKEYLPEGIKYLKRSINLDTDSTKMNEVLLSFSNDVPADIYLMTHATAPFISPSSLEKGLDSVLSGKYDSSFAVKKIQDFLWVDGKPFNYDLSCIPRTQDLKPFYEETSGFYCYTSDVIKKMNRRIGNRPAMIEVSEIESVDIDEQSDFDVANAIYNHILREKI